MWHLDILISNPNSTSSVFVDFHKPIEDETDINDLQIDLKKYLDLENVDSFYILNFYPLIEENEKLYINNQKTKYLVTINLHFRSIIFDKYDTVFGSRIVECDSLLETKTDYEKLKQKIVDNIKKANEGYFDVLDVLDVLDVTKSKNINTAESPLL